MVARLRGTDVGKLKVCSGRVLLSSDHRERQNSIVNRPHSGRALGLSPDPFQSASCAGASFLKGELSGEALIAMQASPYRP